MANNELLLVNPAKKRKRRKATAKRKPAKRRRTNQVTAVAPKRRIKRRRVSTLSPPRYRKRNPARRQRFGFGTLVDQQLIPAAVGASGALVLDVGVGYASQMMPTNMLFSGPMRHLVKAAGAIGMGMVAELLVKKRTAVEMSKGALTVILHDVMKETTQQFAPNVPLGEYISGFDPRLTADGFSSANNGLGYTSYAQPAGVDEGYAYNDLGEYINS